MSGIINWVGARSGIIGKTNRNNSGKIVMPTHESLSAEYVPFASWYDRGDNLTVSSGQVSGFDDGYYLFHCTLGQHPSSGACSFYYYVNGAQVGSNLYIHADMGAKYGNVVEWHALQITSSTTTIGVKGSGYLHASHASMTVIRVGD